MTLAIAVLLAVALLTVGDRYPHTKPRRTHRSNR